MVHLRASDVLVVLFFVLQILVLCCAELKAGDVGTCPQYKKIPDWDCQMVPKKEPCPKKCNSKEFAVAKSKKFNKTDKCCCKKIKKKISTGKYECCDRYEYVLDQDICRPQCRFECRGGRCTAPDHCECDRPLILHNNDTCVAPVCDPSCVNGLCVGNNICECNSDFKRINETHCVKQCKPGYYNDDITLECIPRCEAPCENGACTAPNNCTCFHGFQKSDNLTCTPKCSPNCENGDCIAPNNCSCYKGYIKEDGSCKPVCDQPCKNGRCSEPNICTCNSGYQNDIENKFNCKPICEPQCVNATCVSPNTCSCLPGYENTESNWICKPKCQDCFNGECVAPNKCICLEGFTKIKEKCEPYCEKTCRYGTCTKPYTCTCEEGYKLDNEDKYTCIPKCDPTCINSTCVSPNKCKCLPGYAQTDVNSICKPNCTSCDNGECVAPDRCNCFIGYKNINGTCMPVCSKPCINGVCSAPDSCSCHEGYKNKEDDPSTCHVPCIGPCENGKCNLHGECTCNHGYKFENNTCRYDPVDCSTCKNECVDGNCTCEDNTPCVTYYGHTEPAASSPGLAGLELTWTLAAAVVVLLLVITAVVMKRLYQRRQKFPTEKVEEGNAYGSVVYTVPNTLIQRNIQENNFDEREEEVPLDDVHRPLGTEKKDDAL